MRYFMNTYVFIELLYVEFSEILHRYRPICHALMCPSQLFEKRDRIQDEAGRPRKHHYTDFALVAL